jgi:hypothetical protein
VQKNDTKKITLILTPPKQCFRHLSFWKKKKLGILGIFAQKFQFLDKEISVFKTKKRDEKSQKLREILRKKTGITEALPLIYMS